MTKTNKIKVYIYATTSTGEEAASLDLIRLFTNEADARNLMEKDYEETKEELIDLGYEIDEDYKYPKQWELRIIDDNSMTGETTYRGFLEVQELEGDFVYESK